MSTLQLSRLTAAEQAAWVEAICARAQSANTPHYRGAEAALLRARVERLLLELVGAVRDDTTAFARYSQAVAEQRIAEGYSLSEMLLILDMVEDLAFAHCARVVSDRELLVKNLRVATRTLSGARSALAQVFLEQARRCESALAELRHELGEVELHTLFKGTEAMVV